MATRDPNPHNDHTCDVEILKCVWWPKGQSITFSTGQDILTDEEAIARALEGYEHQRDRIRVGRVRRSIVAVI